MPCFLIFSRKSIYFMSKIISSAPIDRRGFFSRFLADTPEIAAHNQQFNIPEQRFDSDPFLGAIMITAFNFAPRGWALCNGQLLSINTNQGLFSLLGTTYGGNGTTHFALPDFRGRCPIHVGGGFVQGERAGTSTHTLTLAEMPAHTHTLSTPTVQVSGTGTQVTGMVQVGSLSTSNAITLAGVGGSQSHNNMPPYLVLSFCIALQGIFPSSN